MTETIGVDINDEIRRLKLKIAQSTNFAEKEELSGDLLALTMKKVNTNRNLDRMRSRMREAGDQAEKSGVGTGGKGSPPED